ncbi:hypothetical protein OG948_60290 (plasmid) [Embleya sp. NBC_00888]|uniref:hypothetical protein n=1 Tax=Embleya sp. NBC_00888 TaxID=2975960 RepID=UPI002F91A1FA|nr:hypothetical protein OG948_60290 [Embleya sp. NBC_00888]
MWGGRRGEAPEFGFGRRGRPLWTERDRDAEDVRRVLRRARCREFSDRRGGFVVEGGADGGPFALACASESLPGRGEVARYAAALRAAGYHVEPDADDDASLSVWRPGTAPAPHRIDRTPARELVARVIRTVTILGDPNTPPTQRWDLVRSVNAVKPAPVRLTRLSARDRATLETALHDLAVAHDRELSAHTLVIVELLDRLARATDRPRDEVLQDVALALEQALPPEPDHGT